MFTPRSVFFILFAILATFLSSGLGISSALILRLFSLSLAMPAEFLRLLLSLFMPISIQLTSFVRI